MSKQQNYIFKINYCDFNSEIDDEYRFIEVHMQSHKSYTYDTLKSDINDFNPITIQ